MWDKLYRRLRPLFQAPHQILRHIEPGTSVLDIGCGYGDLCGEIVAQKPDCKVTGLDHDGYKIQAARARYGDHPHLDFQQTDLRQLEHISQHTVLIIDVLHYLDADKQATLLEKWAANSSVQKIIARDAIRSWHPGYTLTRLHEFVMTRLGRTYVHQTRFAYRSTEEWNQIARRLNMNLQILKAGLPVYNDHLLIFSRK